MQSNIGCICLTFLHCAFSNVFSNGLPERMWSHIGCICMPFLHCASSCVSSKNLGQSRQSHIGCMCLIFLRCVFSNVSSMYLPERKQSHIGCILLTFLHNQIDFDSSQPWQWGRYFQTDKIPSFQIWRAVIESKSEILGNFSSCVYMKTAPFHDSKQNVKSSLGFQGFP